MKKLLLTTLLLTSAECNAQDLSVDMASLFERVDASTPREKINKYVALIASKSSSAENISDLQISFYGSSDCTQDKLATIVHNQKSLLPAFIIVEKSQRFMILIVRCFNPINSKHETFGFYPKRRQLKHFSNDQSLPK